MQLDVEVSPPAHITGPFKCLDLFMHGAVPLTPVHAVAWTCILKCDFLSSDFWSSMNFGQVTDRQTDIQKVTHNSPLCIRTGGLNKNHCSFPVCLITQLLFFILPEKRKTNTFDPSNSLRYAFRKC